MASPITLQCLKDLSEKRSITADLAKSLAKENVPFEKRSCKEIGSLVRRNAHNISELILFFDGLYKYASKLCRDNSNVEATALFNFLFQQFTKSDYWSVGPLKIQNGQVSKFQGKKESDICELMIELLRMKTELEMLLDETLPAVCLMKFEQILSSSSDGTSEGEMAQNIDLNKFAHDKYMEISAQREEFRKERKLKGCSDCPKTSAVYCQDCRLYRCTNCSKSSHRSLKNHREINISSMKKYEPNSFEEAIEKEQELAVFINHDDPWDEQKLTQQQKLANPSDQIRILRDLISKEKELSKGMHENEISKALHMANGDAKRALQILKKRRQAALKILQDANISGNLGQQLNDAEGDVAKIISDKSRELLESDSSQTAQYGAQLEKLLKNRRGRDVKIRQGMAYAEFFSDLPQGWERSKLLIQVLDFEGNENRARDRDNERWWQDFHLVVFNDLIDAIKNLEEFTFEALIDSPTLSKECELCTDKVNRHGMFVYACSCQPTCNVCIMANMKANIGNAGNLLRCFQNCFQDDKEKMEAEHARLYNHLQHISKQNQSFEEIFAQFEELLNAKVMEEASDTFNCPNNQCRKSWINEFYGPDGKKLKRRLQCPFCKESACRRCQQKWRKEHRNIKCSEYTLWLKDNFPEDVVKLTMAGGFHDNPKIKCPDCQSVFMLDRGGCLHFVCYKCKFEFCGFCSRPFHKPSKNPCNICNVGKGLHAHHPRNCPFYTRDFWRDNMQKLKELMAKKQLAMDKVLPKNAVTSGACEIIETDDQSKENKCPNPAEENCQGYCNKHYVELLCGELFRQKTIDPADVMTVPELRVICDRENVEYEPNDTEEELREALRENCPLDDE